MQVPRGGDEQGQAVLGLLVTAVVLGLGLFLYVALPYGAAADGRAGARTAADAAALAGAQAARAEVLSALAAQGWPTGGWDALSAGAGTASYRAAEAYAAANDAALTSHSFSPAQARTSVSVEGGALPQGAVPRSEADARVGLPPCRAVLEPQELPTPSPLPTPPPSPLPSPLPTLPPLPPLLLLDCGLGTWTVSPSELAGGGVRYLLSEGRRAALAGATTVRLVA